MKTIILLAIFILLANPATAYAYLDPGTGSMLVSMLVGIVVTIVFALKKLYYGGVGAIYAFFGKVYKQASSGLVFYSEGKLYWQVFQPVLDALAAAGESCTYLTSDENDPGLKYQSLGLNARYIGQGNRAYSTLNLLEADICIMTIPGLDVLQIRRSRGVKHYAHLVHAIGDVSEYRLYSLDYYDSLLSAGPHQEASVRELEHKRGTTPKMIFQSGCSYYDGLLKQQHDLSKDEKRGETNCILVAPTWGSNGLLSLYGLDLLLPLAESGYQIIIRPHPQSFISEVRLIQKMKEGLAKFSNITWDNSPNNFEAMTKGDILISDYSSIVFDFAFVMEKPVITLDFEPDLRPYDAIDLKELPWDFTVLGQLGHRLKLEDIPRLSTIISTLLGDHSWPEKLLQLRQASVYNFGCAGPVIAQQLLEIRAGLTVPTPK